MKVEKNSIRRKLKIKILKEVNDYATSMGRT
jgi:hypothetical protein